MKPFKAPALVRRTPSNSQQTLAPSEPPTKKQRISHDAEEDHLEAVAAAANILKQSRPKPKFQAPALRKPLAVVENPSSSLSAASQDKDTAEGYYTVLW